MNKYLLFLLVIAGNFAVIAQDLPNFISAKEVSTITYWEAGYQFKYKKTDLKIIRGERVARLASSDWQIRYLCAFYTIMDTKLKDKTWDNKANRLMYYASAYNYGFTSDSGEIEDWTNQQAFPYGGNGQKEAYATIAKEYYLTINDNE